MPTPTPGRPARGSRSGRPLMVLLDALGRRWALRILWELAGGPRSFRALRAASDDVSPSVLNARLTDLRALGLVEAGAAGYVLTEDGTRLGELLLPLARWAETWAGGPAWVSAGGGGEAPEGARRVSPGGSRGGSGRRRRRS